MANIIVQDGGGFPVLPKLPTPHAEPRGFGTLVRLEVIPGLTRQDSKKFLPFTFQAPPIDTLSINRSYPQTVWDGLDKKQQSAPGVTQLKIVSFRTIFTDYQWVWTLLHGDGYNPNPLEMIDRLEKLGERAVYFRLLIRNPKYRATYDVNMAAALTNFNTEEVGGEIDARYATVEFTQKRHNSIETKREGGGTKNLKLPATVQCNQLPASRNTLYELAQFYYGASSKWRLIAQANGLLAESGAPDFDLRQLGTRKLKIPRQP